MGQQQIGKLLELHLENTRRVTTVLSKKISDVILFQVMCLLFGALFYSFVQN